jgi:arginyl-tRNA synthetase
MPARCLTTTRITRKKDEEDDQFEQDKVIVRSDGTVTYVGKDIAYTLWKFGLLGRDFHYEPFRDYPSGHRAWRSTSRDTGGRPRLPSATARACTTSSTCASPTCRTSCKAGLKALGYEAEAEKFVHFSYEMVALSPRCCAELGIELSEEDQRRPYVEVSGRKGLGVKADDLIDR